MKKRICFLCFLTGIALLLGACGTSENSFTDYSQYLRPASGNTGASAPTAAPGSDFSSAVTVVATPVPAVQAPVSTPAPAGTPTPGPFQTTATPPAQTPVPTPQQNLVQITKSPTSETVEAGGSAVFTAYADNSNGIVWITVSPDARNAYDINNAYTVFPGLQVSGQGTSVLTLSNIPYEMNGWRIQAYFNGNGGPLYTAGAYLTVLQQGGWGSNPSGSGGGVSPGGGGATPGDTTEAAVVTLAKQVYSDVYYQATAAGFSAGSISNYSYLNGRAVFNVTLSNTKCRIVGEFSAWYDAANAYGYGPVHAVVYDLSGNTLLSEHLEGDSMNSFYSIMRNYQN